MSNIQPNIQTFGGVKYDANVFTEKRVVDGKYYLRSYKGQEIRFNEQKDQSIEHTIGFSHGNSIFFNDKSNLYVKGLDGCEIIIPPTDKFGDDIDNNIYLDQCTNSFVDTTIGGGKGIFGGDKVHITGGYGNSAKVDMTDKINIDGIDYELTTGVQTIKQPNKFQANS